MADQQTERSFRKQHAVVVVRRKSATLKKRPRFYRQIGLGFRAPAENERAFQKQFGVNLNRKVKPGITKKKLLRRSRDVGLGFKTPREAIDGTYIDKKCPWTGDVRIRGRILTGVVRKAKMQRTIVIRRDYLHFVRKYSRFEKRHRNMSVHCSPVFRDVEHGDIVTIGECRPLSKTVRFNVLKVSKGQGSKKSFKKY
ncbi:40S ribosomal protein S11 isoform X3 [Drosophila biarmipes]|uniref:40S ribosomal protein S11 isoform X3 n=1 Tax=Drosophila biarmipes TaxID=125945 RepID=UPI0021CCFC57|nr:40S ribosomal protein S11 isoform X3 [Drosophila biarmipes]